jgi:hypothetical protein
MTFARLTAAAQQRETVLGRLVEGPVDRCFEGSVPGHLAVAGVAFGVELGFALRAPAAGTRSGCRWPPWWPLAPRG